MAVVQNGGGKKKPKPPEVPTPVISPLPLPKISPLLRNLLAGTPQQQAVQQPKRQLTRFEIMRNAIAGGNLPTVSGPPTLPVGRADPRRGRGTGVNRPFITDVARSLGLELGPSIFGGFSTADPRSPAFGQETPATSSAGLLQRTPAGTGFDAAPAAPITPQVTTPQSPFALEAGLFHQARQFVVRKIFEAVDTNNRNRLPGEITNVIAALLPWRDWGFSSYQEALKALGYTEIPGAGTWIKDEEITSSTVGGSGGLTNTGQAVQQGSFNIGGGGAIRSPQFSTLINWRI